MVYCLGQWGVTGFQSTLPVWGATYLVLKGGGGSGFQSTLPVWGATPALGQHHQRRGHFNPRSPCGERPPVGLQMAERKKFQSTLPVWGAT